MKEQITLTKEQVDKLLKYVDYINYIDLKYEIVDHLASSIEEKMTANPIKSFNTVFYDETSNIPLTGFYEFTCSKEKALNRYWIKKILTHLKYYLTLPKLLASLVLVFVLFKTSQIIQPIPFQWIGLGICIMYTSLTSFKRYNNEKYLFVEQFRKVLSYTAGFFFIFWWLMIHLESISNSTTIVFAIIMVFQIVLAFALNSKKIHQIMIDEIAKKYKYLFF